jgi:thymidine phosphorylase
VLAELYSDSKSGIDDAKKRIINSIKISKSKPQKLKLIKTIIN